MYIKLLKYTLQDGRMEEFLTLQEQLDALYQKHARVEIELLRDETHPASWMEIQYYEDKEAYEKVAAGLQTETRGKVLQERFHSMLDPLHPSVEEHSFLSFDRS